MKQALIGVAGGLFAGLVALGLLFTGPLGADNGPVAQEQASQTPEVTAKPSPSETISEPVEPVEEVIACSVSELEQAPGILELQAQVLRADSGEVLFDRASQTPARAASVMKLFTAAAALETLGPNYRVTTRVYVDEVDPSIIYLVGGGDVTLSRAGVNQSSVYKDAPRLSQLVNQVARKLGTQTFSQIVLDSSAYGTAAGEYQNVWDQRGLTDGYMSYVSALQVDGDRNNPGAKDSPRSKDPVQRAGLWFKEALGQSALDATVVKGAAPANAIEVASVQSAPLSTWIDYMLVVSDNTLAEAMARLVSLDVGLDGSFASLTDAFKRALQGSGLDLSGISVQDGSGLSRNNLLAPAQVNELLKLIASGYGDFELIQGGMPVSGTPGSLSARFVDATGDVTAKTGWIRTGYTLAGYLDIPGDTGLIFTVYNLGDVTMENREAMDDLVLGFYECGTDLVGD
jgi:D-alanyl-D-alanine carboxypeptidase/D-alanyl-D-alanine-endopeptidase (penicillin-binding protein 4)